MLLLVAYAGVQVTFARAVWEPEKLRGRSQLPTEGRPKGGENGRQTNVVPATRRRQLPLCRRTRPRRHSARLLNGNNLVGMPQARFPCTVLRQQTARSPSTAAIGEAARQDPRGLITQARNGAFSTCPYMYRRPNSICLISTIA